MIIGVEIDGLGAVLNPLLCEFLSQLKNSHRFPVRYVSKRGDGAMAKILTTAVCFAEM